MCSDDFIIFFGIFVQDNLPHQLLRMLVEGGEVAEDFLIRVILSQIDELGFRHIFILRNAVVSLEKSFGFGWVEHDFH